METWIRFALLGLGPGAVYALAALAIVIPYRASGILNFASGAMGAVAAFAFFELRDRHDVYWLLALLLSIALGAALGAAAQLGVLEQLRSASPLTKLIATLGMLTVLQGLVVAVWDDDQRLVRPILEVDQLQITDTLSVSRDRIVLLVIAVALASVLALFYRRTLFGLATSAVSENRRGASSVGWSARRIELLNWMMGGALAALAGVLLAPITGLRASTLTLLIIPSLAAALIGGFASFTLTVLGGLLIGVAESELSRFNGDVPGISRAVPFLIIVVVMIAGGRARPTRGDLPSRLPLPGTGRVLPALAVVSSSIAVAFAVLAPDRWVTSLITAAIAGLMILSIVVVTGYGGQLSLGQWALAGFAAWVSSRLAEATSLNFWVAAPIAILATIPVAVLVGLPALRSRGVNLAIATAGLALLIEAMLLGNPQLTGGFNGTTTRPPSFFGLELDAVVSPTRYAVFAVVLLGISAGMVANVRRSRSGLRLLAVRSNERAAAALGINVFAIKLYAFALASVFAAMAGILTAFRSRFVLFPAFNVFGSIEYVTYSVIGGVGWVAGALLSSLTVRGSVIPELVDSAVDLGDWIVVLLGVVVLIVVMVAQDGIAARWAQLGHRLIKAPSSALDAPRIPRRAHVDVTMRVDALSVNYGNVRALDDVSFDVPPRSIVGLIGPNGAGKTTLLDAVTGFTRPSAGRVLVDDVDITDWSPSRRARLGVGRSFQSVELFEEMTVQENLLTAVERHENRRFLTDPVWPGALPVSDLMLQVIEDFGLEAHLQSRPPGLPQGVRRIVGIARAILNEPSVVFLDEPAAGLDEIETAELGVALRRVVQDYGISIVLVEHDVPLVLELCEQIVVLDFGARIAIGPPEKIRSDPMVVSAYLGAEGEGWAGAAEKTAKPPTPTAQDRCGHTDALAGEVS